MDLVRIEAVLDADDADDVDDADDEFEAERVDAAIKQQCFRKKYYPLSKKFKVLRILGTDVPLVDEVASVAMHIAVVCPNFAFVDLLPEHRKEFSQEIARTIAKRPFRPFADSIRHLMFKD
ncbi:hypothetical protein H4S03_001138 [Coemansia sp. S3946]|nr:hypothetical protein H4S03_001138 [Coemansia sp. S3946]